MLGRRRLRSTDVEHLVARLVLLHEVVVLFFDALDSGARLRLGALPDVLEHLLEVLDLIASLVEVWVNTFESSRSVASLASFGSTFVSAFSA